MRDRQWLLRPRCPEIAIHPRPFQPAVAGYSQPGSVGQNQTIAQVTRKSHLLPESLALWGFHNTTCANVHQDFGPEVAVARATPFNAARLPGAFARAVWNSFKASSGRFCDRTLSVTFEEGTWAHDLLKPRVDKLVVCNPRKNAFLKDGNKSDRFDACKLAELLRGNRLKPVYHGETGVRIVSAES